MAAALPSSVAPHRRIKSSAFEALWEDLTGIERFDCSPFDYVDDLGDAQRAGTLAVVNEILADRENERSENP